MSDTTGNAPDFAAGRRTDSLCNPAPVPAASPPTDVVSENNRVELRKALFADPVAGETGAGEGERDGTDDQGRALWRRRCPVCGKRFGHFERWIVSVACDSCIIARLQERVSVLEGALHIADGIRVEAARLRERVEQLEGALRDAREFIVSAHHHGMHGCGEQLDAIAAALSTDAERREDAP